MKRQTYRRASLAMMLGILSCLGGCSKSANVKTAEAKEQKAAESPGQVLETVDLKPGKVISPEDRAKVSSIGLKILSHVSKAQEDIGAKNVDAAKKELTQATTLLTIVKTMLPTVNIIDHIWVTKSNLDYVNTTEVQQDMIAIETSIDQLYAVLPAGNAKEHTKLAKDVLKKEKGKGASKAKEELEAVEEALAFSEVDLSVSYTGRLVKAAQEDLGKGKTKEAGNVLQAVTDGLVFYDATVINPVDLVLRSIWLAKQDYTAKNYKAAKVRLRNAKSGLQEIAKNGNKTQAEGAKHLIGTIDAIDVITADDKMGPTFEALWQESRKLADQPQVADTKQPAGQDKTAKFANEAFIRAADQINLAEIKLGQIAEEKSTNSVVKKFGEHGAREHSLMNKELREISSKKGISLSDNLDPKHQELIDELSKLKGAAFDAAYTKDMVAGHEAAIKQFEIEIKTGRDADVKAWAEKCLPILRAHLKLAQAAAEDVKKK